MRFDLPNYTMVPNEFLDHVLRDITSMSELKVTLAVIRHTFGFHAHGGAELSKSWLREYTGMADNSVDDGLRRAIARGTIVVVREADASTSRPATYRLNIDVPEDLLQVIRRARPGSGMAPGTVEKDGGASSDPGEGQVLTRGGSKVDPGEGQKLTRGGSNPDPGWGIQTPSPSAFAGPLNKDRNKDRNKEDGWIDRGPVGSEVEVLEGITQASICFDESIDIRPAVRACENAGVFFAGVLRMTVENMLERGMEPEVAAALITEAHTKRDKMKGVGFERWAAAFVRNAFQDGVRTMEDLTRYRERAKEGVRTRRRPWDPRPKRESYTKGVKLDWDAWNKGGSLF